LFTPFIFLYRDFGAFISLLKSVVGTGVLSLPLAFYFAGIINGIILLILASIMLIHGIQMLVSLGSRS